MRLQYDKPHGVLVDEVRGAIKPRLARSGPSKRLARRWEHRLSEESLTQGESPLKGSARTGNPSSIIPLGTGRPTSTYYPWQSMTMTGTKESRQSRAPSPQVSMRCKKGETAFDLSSAFNYGDPSGCAELVDSFREYTRLIHNPPYQDWDTTLTCGSTSAIEIALRMFCNRGDWILTEAFTYPGTVMAAKAQGLKMQGIEMDEGGLVPADLAAKLQSWDTLQGRKPVVLYTIPSGHNPTGTTQSAARKNAIYEIAERHDLLILEDDPYFFLRLNNSPTPADTTPSFSPLGHFWKSLPTSYLSLDKSGRVIRMESSSKILAPGLRCGWLTASKQIVDIFANFAEVGPSHPSGPSQVMLYKLLVENWGQEGFVNWLDHLSEEYRSRRDAMILACDRHLPKELCTWSTPEHGMFLWLTVDLERHPGCAGDKSQEDHVVEDRIYERAESNGVIVAKGSWFNVGKCAKKAFFRMTFVATDSQNDLEQGVKQFGKAVRAEFGLL